MTISKGADVTEGDPAMPMPTPPSPSPPTACPDSALSVQIAVADAPAGRLLHSSAATTLTVTIATGATTAVFSARLPMTTMMNPTA